VKLSILKVALLTFIFIFDSLLAKINVCLPKELPILRREGGVFFFDPKKRVYATKASNLRSGGTFGLLSDRLCSLLHFFGILKGMLSIGNVVKRICSLSLKRKARANSKTEKATRPY
jgi:hypothetical protein